MAKHKTTVQILKDARALLVEKGWCQETYCSADGRYCAAGAINIAAGDGVFSSGSDLTLAARNALGRVVCEGIVNWNDARSRTKRQVLAAFTKAIKAEEAKKARA